MRRLVVHPLFVVWAAFTMGWTLGSTDSLVTWAVSLIALCAGFMFGIWRDWDRD